MPKLTTEEVRKLLRKRYQHQQWVFLEEVKNSAGYSYNRSCDAIAFNLWPSKGLEIHGHEIKVSRSDWLAELKDPDKAESFKRYCDRWWIVISSKNIVKREELPESWGLLRVHGKKLAVVKGAPKLEPEPLPKSFVAALLHRAKSTNLTAMTLSAEYSKGFAAGENAALRRFKQQKEALENLQKSVEAFREASGININTYNGQTLGEAVSLIISLQGKFGQLNRVFSTAEKLREDTRNLTKSLRQLKRAVKSSPLVKE